MPQSSAMFRFHSLTLPSRSVPNAGDTARSTSVEKSALGAVTREKSWRCSVTSTPTITTSPSPISLARWRRTWTDMAAWGGGASG